jgi:CheY-like chemotaxis protein
MIPSGIGIFDARMGGLDPGGVYLISGTPGPAKLVAVFQFLNAGIAKGERVFLLTGIEAPSVLSLAKAWGSDLQEAWARGDLTIAGFREDFEMRVLRSTEPEDALAELDRLVPEKAARIAVDPGSMFLQEGGRSLLGRVFLEWARQQPATVLATLSIDGAEGLPANAEWLVQSTSGVLLLQRRPGGLLQLSVQRAFPASAGSDDPVTLQLTPGLGLTAPDQAPTRRSSDRPVGEPDQLLMISLGGPSAPDVEGWVRGTFRAEVVTDPLEAVTRLQGGAPVGCVLVHAPRQRLREALQACRAVRPMTAAAVVFTSDDAVRSTDRVNLLEAGADDCLTGGVDFRELTTRIRQAVSVGGKPPAPIQIVTESEGPQLGGLVPPNVFRREVESRGSHPTQGVFSLLRLGAEGVSPEELGNALAGEVRDEEGDLVSCGAGGCLVLLQGARRDSTNPFLARFRRTFEKQFGREWALRVEVLAHPAEKEQVKEILDLLPTSDRQPSSSRALGGSSGWTV